MVYHGPQRGVRSIYLREPPQNDLKDDQLKHWDLTSQVTLPNDDHTHYWCRIFKAPKLDRKHHMVALRPIIQVYPTLGAQSFTYFFDGRTPSRYKQSFFIYQVP